MRIDRILRNGESAEAHVLMGLALREAHDLAGAVQSFGKAVALNPNLPDVHAMCGLALIASGNRDKAREEFEAELKANPHDYTANVNLGVIAKEDQRLDEASAFLERALKVRPTDPAARYQVATLKMAANDVDAARATLEALVAEHPNWLEPHVSLATVYYRLKRKADGDREREIVDRLTKEAQARQPGAKPQPAPPVSQPPCRRRRCRLLALCRQSPPCLRSDTLTLRQINRATLARQMLLAREKTTPAKAIERLVGMQAQWPKPPFLGLWTASMASSVTTSTALLAQAHGRPRHVPARHDPSSSRAKDFLALRPAIQPVLESAMQAILKERLDGIDVSGADEAGAQDARSASR